VALAAALLLTACSGDEPSDEEGAGPDRTVVEEGLAALFAGDHASERDGESGACFAEELVDRAGVERLTEAGVLADDGRVVEALPTFDEETAGLWVDAQLACVDYVEESTEALAAQTKGELDREVYAACLRDAITDGAIREAMVATLMGRFDAPAVTTLSDAQVGCRGSAT
jgi:hypothetical protein